MSTIKAVIFDMDGVLTDTMPLYYKATRDTLLPYGVDYTWEQNNRLKGISRRETIRTVCLEAGMTIDEGEEIRLAEERNARYLKLIDMLAPRDVLPGIQPFLKELRDRRIPTAVASSSRNAPEVLERTGLSDQFDVVIDPLTLSKGKPDPEIFLKAQEILGVEERACIGIEDGEAGLKGLLGTKMFTIGVGTDAYMRKAHWPIASTSELKFQELEKRHVQWLMGHSSS